MNVRKTIKVYVPKAEVEKFAERIAEFDGRDAALPKPAGVWFEFEQDGTLVDTNATHEWSGGHLLVLSRHAWLAAQDDAQ